MAYVTKEQELAGHYDLKFRIEKDIGKTKDEMGADQRIIPAVGESVLAQLNKELEAVEEKINQRWEEAERHGEAVGVQDAFGFYWECEIDVDEAPF